MTGKLNKIAFISHASLLNGAPVSLAEIAVELVKQTDRFELHFGLPVPGPILKKYLLTGANPFFYARNFLGREILVTNLRIKARLKKIFIRKKIDLVVANTLESFRAVEAASELNIPSIWMIRELLTRYEKRRELGEIKKCAFRASRLIFNSQTSLKLLPILGEGLEDRSRLIYEGISLPPPLRKDFRPELGLNPRDVLVGSVGDICPQKGYRSLLEAFPAISRRFPRAKLLLIGRTPHRFREFFIQLKDSVTHSGIAGKVLFSGEKEDIFHWMNSLDLLIHPSWGESFGRVIVEALALEKPVVAARSGGAEEIIEDGRTGLLIPPRDPEALTRAIEWVLEHPRLAGEMGKKGRIMVEKKFPLARTVGELREEIENFLG